tara:strand:- start:784 stop:1059 length:276 start_codon:yes stop_codon:yes gene_type:complete
MRRKPQVDIGVGDLVRHVLMDDGWLGVVVKIEEQVREQDSNPNKLRVIKAQVHIVSDHCFPEFRNNKNRKLGLGRKFGWVDVAWLKVKNKA